MRKIAFTLALIFTAATAFTQTTDTLRYTIGDQDFIGFIAKPEKITSETKTIIIVHEWWGLTEYPKMRAEQLAKDGFIAFCADMFGNGATAANPEEAKKMAGPFYADPQLSYDRFMGAYNALIADPQVNKERVAAIGYCFGGNVVLNAAKMGAPVDAAVSFHGGLKGVPAEKDKLKAAILVCHGQDDTFVPQDEVDAFKKEMADSGADFKFIAYPGATHAFTNPLATENGKKFNMPIRYNEAADKKSYADFMKFVAKKVL
jgi:dienelactone hydrolase